MAKTFRTKNKVIAPRQDERPPRPRHFCGVKRSPARGVGMFAMRSHTAIWDSQHKRSPAHAAREHQVSPAGSQGDGGFGGRRTRSPILKTSDCPLCARAKRFSSQRNRRTRCWPPALKLHMRPCRLSPAAEQPSPPAAPLPAHACIRQANTWQYYKADPCCAHRRLWTSPSSNTTTGKFHVVPKVSCRDQTSAVTLSVRRRWNHSKAG